MNESKMSIDFDNILIVAHNAHKQLSWGGTAIPQVKWKEALAWSSDLLIIDIQIINYCMRWKKVRWSGKKDKAQKIYGEVCG